MASQHLPNTSTSRRDLTGSSLDPSGTALTLWEHLQGMDTQSPARPDLFDVLSLAELANRLHVSAQTIYDPRKEG